MNSKAFHTLIFSIVVGVLFAALITSVFSQSQSSNGQIEGTVSDQSNSAIPNVVVTAKNIETGAARKATTDDKGNYHFPLLPLGTYRITAVAANFKAYIQDGVTLATGQSVTVDLRLSAGDVLESVTVSADTSVADAGKTDVSRVMNTREAQNLPLISRNPYNFGILQAGVNGRASRGHAPFIGINANGYLRRVSFQLDGNTNVQGDHGTIRFMSISDTYVSEIQLLTNGFAAEYGNTPGMIMNVVTPSGTNQISGSVGFRFRVPSFYSRPFFYPSPGDIPDNRASDLTAAIGGPIIKDRWHFYAGYENQKRDDKALAARLLTISPDDKATLIADAGLSSSIFPFAAPSFETGKYLIFRTDVQLNGENRLTVRFNHADQQTKNLAGRFDTLDRSMDVFTVDYGIAAQLTSYTSRLFNELRFQYAYVRRPSGVGGSRNKFSGTGPSIDISRVANFGSPDDVDTIFPPRRITQIQDNLLRMAGSHVFKFGGGFNFYDHTERSAVFARYTFPSLPAYLNARNGINRQSYTSFAETLGDPEIRYKATFWNFFAQDDWKVMRHLKLAYGLRYDLYLVPKADASSALTASQKFHIDKNNFAPRVGVVYAIRDGRHPTIIRAGAGIYYDQPLLLMYQRALLNNGTRRFFTLSISPGLHGAPNFPNTLSSLPSESPLPAEDIDTIAPDFENMYAVHTDIQIEHVLNENLSATVGYIHSAGRHIPIYRNINCKPTTGTLADGRLFFGARMQNPNGTLSIQGCQDRVITQFQNILMVESAGISHYDAMTLQLTKRYSRGLQFSVNYTLSKATDDAPEQNLTNGNNFQNLVLSDPTNRRLDRGRSFADQRHTFVMSLVAEPRWKLSNRMLHYLFNGNQIGLIATANSGETFNIVSTLDLNGDGIASSDRPVGIKRNSGTTPPQYDADLRYSRFFRFSDRYKLEVFGEFQNLFNTNSIVAFGDVTVTADPTTGRLIGELPDFESKNRSANKSTAQDSRQFQIGIKLHF